MRSPCKLCGKPSVGRLLCSFHYEYERRHGDLSQHKPTYNLDSLEEKLKQYVITPTGCWEWTSRRMSGKFQYGTLTVGNKPLLAHRASYEFHKGPLPDGMLACHHCDNPPCINPDHLFAGTRGDNARDAAKKNRMSNHHAKLSVQDIMDIRAAKGLKQYELAEKYGCSRSMISLIRSGKARRKAFY